MKFGQYEVTDQDHLDGKECKITRFLAEEAKQHDLISID
jgi:hypothetical protein